MGLGWQELLIVLLIIITIFGVGKLPEVGSALGRGVKDFKETKDAGFESPVTATTRQDGGKAIETRELRADHI